MLRNYIFLFLIFFSSLLAAQELNILRNSLEEDQWEAAYPEPQFQLDPLPLEIEFPGLAITPFFPEGKEYPYIMPEVAPQTQTESFLSGNNEKGWLYSQKWSASNSPLSLRLALASEWEEPERHLSFYSFSNFIPSEEIHLHREISFREVFRSGGSSVIKADPISFQLDDQWEIDNRIRVFLKPQIDYEYLENDYTLALNMRTDSDIRVLMTGMVLPVHKGRLGVQLNSSISEKPGVFPEISYGFPRGLQQWKISGGFGFPDFKLFKEELFMRKISIAPHSGSPFIFGRGTWRYAKHPVDFQVSMEITKGAIPLLIEDNIDWGSDLYTVQIEESLLAKKGSFGILATQLLILETSPELAVDSEIFFSSKELYVSIYNSKSLNHLLDVYEQELWYNGFSCSWKFMEDWTIGADLQFKNLSWDFASLKMSYRG